MPYEYGEHFKPTHAKNLFDHLIILAFFTGYDFLCINVSLLLDFLTCIYNHLYFYLPLSSSILEDL